jgi:hypothetical protein
MKSRSSTGAALQWASQQILSIDEQVKMDAVSALMNLKMRTALQQHAPPDNQLIQSPIANNLDNIFRIANQELENQMQKEFVCFSYFVLLMETKFVFEFSYHQIAEQNRQYRSEQDSLREQFTKQAEASIDAFLKEQKRIRDEADAREKALKLEQEAKEREAAETNRIEEQKQLEAEEAQRVQTEEDKQKAAITEAAIQDNTTLLPAQVLPVSINLH